MMKINNFVMGLILGSIGYFIYSQFIARHHNSFLSAHQLTHGVNKFHNPHYTHDIPEGKYTHPHDFRKGPLKKHHDNPHEYGHWYFEHNNPIIDGASNAPLYRDNSNTQYMLKHFPIPRQDIQEGDILSRHQHPFTLESNYLPTSV